VGSSPTTPTIVIEGRVVRRRSPPTSIALAALVAAVVAACGSLSATQTPMPSPTPSPAAAPSATATADAASPIPVLIDTDMAADDIVALAAILRDPGVDVRAIAVDGTGATHCAAGVANVHRLLDAFGMPEVPVGCGRAEPGPNGRVFPDEWRADADDMYGLSLPAPSTTTSQDAAQLIVDTAAATDGKLTIVAIGPWTNIADALAADPSVATKIALHVMGGALVVEGNVDSGGTRPADGVEWNLGVDPDADAAVLASAVPITLLPLDATNYVPVGQQFVTDLGTDHAAAGADIVHELLERSPFMTSGDWYIWDPLAALTLTAPDLVTWEDVLVTFQQTGRAAGRLIPDDEEGRPIRAAVAADPEMVFDTLLAALRRGAPRP
jgi:purine nucleosidase